MRGQCSKYYLSPLPKSRGALRYIVVHMREQKRKRKNKKKKKKRKEKEKRKEKKRKTRKKSLY